jgi:protein TonB
VAHALSVSSARSARLSPPALALAVLLHALVALALWWISINSPQPPAEQPIDITFEPPKTVEQPKPEPPPPPPPPQEAARQPPAPTLPPELGLRPPAPITSDKPTQVPPSGERPNEPPAPPPPMEQALPAPDPEAPPPTPSEFAKSAPKLPPLQEPPSQAQEQHALAAPQNHAPPTPQPTRPQAPPQPRPPPPELRPSPLTMAPTYRPPGGAPRDNASPSPLVNPADVYSRARVADNYLWQVVRKLIGYSYQAHVSARQGITVVRIVIARDGRLLDVGIAQTSGYPEFDRGAVAGVRAGAPYAPLPPEIHGDSATFNLPLVSVNR